MTARTGDAGSAIAAAEAGCVLVAVGMEKQFAGSILMADPVRADVGEMLAGLRRDGVKRLVLATGDAPRWLSALQADWGSTPFTRSFRLTGRFTWCWKSASWVR